jgi:hypothetical protein
MYSLSKEIHMNAEYKYLQCVKRLQKRYTVGGYIVLSHGGTPSPYTKLEKAAAVKYLRNGEPYPPYFNYRPMAY